MSSNKMPVAWHKQSLANRRGSMLRRKAELEALTKAYERDIVEFELYAFQVKEAERLDMEAFDPERFRIPRKKK